VLTRSSTRAGARTARAPRTRSHVVPAIFLF
jgi:hypothetical protein